MIGIIVLGLAFILGIGLAIKDKRTYDRIIQQIGRQTRNKQKEYIFVNEEELDAEHAGLLAENEDEETEALYWS